jgi:hypothetical protein
MTLYFLNNVFGLHLSLETAQSILKGFAFLNSNLCHEKTPPNIPKRDIYQNTPVWRGLHGDGVKIAEHPPPGGISQSIPMTELRVVLVVQGIERK